MTEVISPDNMTLAENMIMAMKLANEYENKHKDVVRKKLLHAQSATKQCFEDLNRISSGGGSQQIQELENKYSKIWTVILGRYDCATVVPEKMLAKIEHFLKKLPAMIINIYNSLIQSDKKLIKLMGEISDKKYKTALKIIKHVQEISHEIMLEVWPEAAKAEEAEIEVFGLDRVMGWAGQNVESRI